MFRRTVSAVIIAMLLTGILTVAFNVQPVRSDYAWTETIYIRADGSIQPSTAPISSVDNGTYTLTDNIAGVPASSNAIVIQRDNITINGAGHTLQGTQAYVSTGIELTGRSNVTIKNMKITAFDIGIWLDSSSNNSVSGNSIAANYGYDIWLDSSSNNSVSGNNITNNFGSDIWLDSSSNNNSISGNNITTTNSNGIAISSSSNNNSISGNNITNSGSGIWLSSSNNTTISGNNITNNQYGIYLYPSSNNSISGNTFTNDGLALRDSYQNSVENNTINGKPLVYLEGITNNSVGDAGQVILVKCDSITVENLNLSIATVGVELVETNNSNISSNNITANNLDGVLLYSSSNNSINENNVANNINDGIHFYFSSNNNSISGNNVTANGCGIELWSSCNYNRISRNNLADNGDGVLLGSSSNNSISGNNMTDNFYGVEFAWSSNNEVYHNSFIHNTGPVQAGGDDQSVNLWDDGYPSGGNYWSDYNGTDLCSGSYQNETDSDGIGDAPYVVYTNITDRYPLIAPLGMFNFVVNVVGSTGPINVDLMTNSTVKNVQIDEMARTLSFNVNGATGTLGFCRITIPNIIVKSLWNGNYTVLMNGLPCPFTNSSDNEDTYIYINYTHSEHTVTIIPELPSPLAIPALMMATLLVVVVNRRRRNAER